MFRRRSYQQKPLPNSNGVSTPYMGHATQFFTDNMTGTDGTLLTAHTSDSGHSWSRINGTGDWTIQTNRVFEATAGAIVKASAVAPKPDHYVEGVIDLITDVADNIGILAHLDGSVNGYMARYDQATDNWGLFRFDAAAATNIGGAGFTDNWTTGSRTVRLQFLGTNVLVYIDGTLRVSATDSTYRAGSPGLRGTTGMTTTTHHHVTSLIAVG